MASDVREPLNIGSDQVVSIDELVTVAERIGGTTLDRRYKLDAPLGVRGRNSNNDRVQALIGWRPRVTIEEGLRGTYAWIEGEIAAGRLARGRRNPAARGDAGW